MSSFDYRNCSPEQWVKIGGQVYNDQCHTNEPKCDPYQKPYPYPLGCAPVFQQPCPPVCPPRPYCPPYFPPCPPTPAPAPVNTYTPTFSVPVNLVAAPTLLGRATFTVANNGVVYVAARAAATPLLPFAVTSFNISLPTNALNSVIAGQADTIAGVFTTVSSTAVVGSATFGVIHAVPAATGSVAEAQAISTFAFGIVSPQEFSLRFQYLRTSSASV